MKTRSVFITLFGIWFIAAPSVFGYTDLYAAAWISVGLGIVQIIASLWSLRYASGDSPPHLVTLLTGLVMAVMPFTLLSDRTIWISAAIGVLTILFSFANLSVRARK
ncbi:hypothetical protein N0M98_25605 [Paenibacillus doosanensis]|uniref:SPW repeat-containing integral membrane domain-containing protein n=1 Tax=Paenibacillus konkukensis TaxID=2020716 RepID=A0ABY4RPV3_9BACL|nr:MULTISPECIES: hypothetical protein [Paenibacillus]MCS7463487.1 hypothetical protein [Paenibacillus doosanensis]UQZ83429.1 hypothetical protein SK3146_02616 [Paenibacillus konkukensis]